MLKKKMEKKSCKKVKKKVGEGETLKLQSKKSKKDVKLQSLRNVISGSS
jgi:hypothetical protein